MKRWLLLSTLLIVGAAGYFFFNKKSEIAKPVITGTATESTEKARGKKNLALAYGKPKSADELKYETVDDLSLISDDIKSRAEAGDAVAQRIYGRMLEECQHYSITYKTFKADLDAMSKSTVPFVNLNENIGVIVEKRCKNFTNGSRILSEEPYLWYSQAAIKKDAQSMAKVMSMTGVAKMTDQELKDNVNVIIASKDPEAFMELANIMGEHNQSRAAVLGKYSGDRRSEYAWRLAACRLGANCSAKSQLLINLCLYGGAKSACVGNRMEVVFQKDMFSPADFEAVANSSTGLINSLINP